jgi:hypothetical protein
VLDAPSWLECVLWGSFDIGDHTMVVGQVVAAGVQPRRPALVFLYGRYHALEDTRLGVPRRAAVGRRTTGEDATMNGSATGVDRAPGRPKSGDHTEPLSVTAPVCDSPTAR